MCGTWRLLARFASIPVICLLVLYDCVVPGGTQSLPGEDEQLHEPKLTP